MGHGKGLFRGVEEPWGGGGGSGGEEGWRDGTPWGGDHSGRGDPRVALSEIHALAAALAKVPALWGGEGGSTWLDMKEV